MCKENIIRAFAGTFILISCLLSVLVNIHWLWLAAFVGVNLLQSSFTKYCPLEKILSHFGIGNSSCNSPKN